MASKDSFLLFPTSLLDEPDPKAGMRRILAFAVAHLADATELWAADREAWGITRLAEAMLVRIGPHPDPDDELHDCDADDTDDARVAQWAYSFKALGFMPENNGRGEAWRRIVRSESAIADEARKHADAAAEYQGTAAQKVRLKASTFVAAWKDIQKGARGGGAWTWDRFRVYCAMLARCAGHDAPWRITRPEIQAVASGLVYKAVKTGKVIPDPHWTDKRIRNALEWLIDKGYITRLIVSPRVTKYVIGREPITKLDAMEQRSQQRRSQRDAEKARELQAQRKAERAAQAEKRCKAAVVAFGRNPAGVLSLSPADSEAEYEAKRKAELARQVAILQGREPRLE